MSEEDYRELDAHIKFVAWITTGACAVYPLSTCRATYGVLSNYSRVYLLYSLLDDWRN